MPKVWMIRGFDGTTPTYAEDVPVECFSDEEMIALLKCLASRHLEPFEIVASSLPERCDGRRDHLDVRPIGGDNRGFMTNGGWHYVANVVEAE